MMACCTAAVCRCMQLDVMKLASGGEASSFNTPADKHASANKYTRGTTYLRVKIRLGLILYSWASEHSLCIKVTHMAPKSIRYLTSCTLIHK